MAVDGREVHSETDEARAGSTPHVVRWILGISLVAAIVLLSIVWMTGAAMQGDVEEEANVSNIQRDVEAGAASEPSDTDGILIEGADEIEPAQSEDALDTPNPATEGAAQDGAQ